MVINAFSNLDLHQVTPMGKSKEDEEEGEEEDEEGEVEEPMQVTDEDNTGKEVVKVPMPEIPEAVEALASISSVVMP